jgi:hypothetical protein
MSIIKAVYIPSANQWMLSSESLDPFWARLNIGYNDQSDTADLAGLKFGFELHQGDNLVASGAYPPVGVRYVKSDQPYLVAEHLELKPEQTYHLRLWLENVGQKPKGEMTFTTPRPDQPYPSWVWSNGKWTAPTPMPEDGALYTWDESALLWVVYESTKQETK